MKTTIEEQKINAIEILEKLDIYKPYINGFKDKDRVCFFENFGGFWVFQEPEIEAKMKEIEKQYNCKVYAITHEYINGDEMYSFLLINRNPDEWEYLIESYGNRHNVFAYVWNKSVDWCSEFGTIPVQSFGGGIRRVA